MKRMDQLNFGRYSDPALLILASLAGGAKHGYAMMLDIEQITGVHLGPGTLYGALARLQRAQLIAALPSNDRRQPYQLTAQGSTLLRNQLTMLSNFIELVLKRLIA
jgi:DNA-binding PadR family transcriptional regulator